MTNWVGMSWWEWTIDMGLLVIFIGGVIGYCQTLKDISDAGENAREEMAERRKSGDK